MERTRQPNLDFGDEPAFEPGQPPEEIIDNPEIEDKDDTYPGELEDFIRISRRDGISKAKEETKRRREYYRKTGKTIN
ncbi:MAG TPA: hypothetical protein VFX17_01885 [Patescibacteria group bacterium]|nr:hypothetical protein [Patescibacteria group bacterium]